MMSDRQQEIFPDNVPLGPKKSKPKGFSNPIVIHGAIVAALIATASWGTWVTSHILAPQETEQSFVKLQLQGMISEFIRANHVLAMKKISRRPIPRASWRHWMRKWLPYPNREKLCWSMKPSYPVTLKMLLIW